MDSFIFRAFLGGMGVLCAFGFIIFIHELGHFLIARRVGIRCPNFAIGFGKPLVALHWKGTVFSLRLFPFGGYVQMVGEDPETEGIDTWHDLCERFLGQVDFPATPAEMLAGLETRKIELPMDDDPELQAQFDEVQDHVLALKDRTYADLRDVEGNFNYKTIPQRMAVILGGVTMNFISALLLIWIIGTVAGLGVITQDSSPRIARVLPDTPAARAGIEAGALVMSVEGKEILSGGHMVEVISSYPARPITVTYQNPGEPVRETRLTPDVYLGDYQFTAGRDGLPMVGSLSKAKGLKAREVVLAVDGDPVTTLAALAERLGASAGGRLSLQVEGKAEPVIVEVPPGKRPIGRMGVQPGTINVIRLVKDVVDEVEPGSPAELAGVVPGDVIEAANGFSVTDQEQLNRAMAAMPGEKDFLIKFTALGKMPMVLDPGASSDREAGFTMRPAGAGDAMRHSLRSVGFMVVAPGLLVYGLFHRAIAVGDVVETSAGPLGIMHMLYALSDNGVAQFLFFVAMINAAVGAFNLIPFPALDGSRFLILMISAIRRREFDPDKEARLHYVGLMVLLTVVLVITLLDIRRIFSGVNLIE